MPEIPSPPENKSDNDKIFLMIDLLYHGMFRQTFTPEAHSNFLTRLSDISQLRPSPNGPIVIQYMLEDPSKTEDGTDNLLWFGIEYELGSHTAGFELNTKGLFYPNDSRDLCHMKGYENVPSIVLTETDINWDEMPSHGAHTDPRDY